MAKYNKKNLNVRVIPTRNNVWDSDLLTWSLPPPVDPPVDYNLNSYSDFPLLDNNGGNFYEEPYFLSQIFSVYSEDPLIGNQFYRKNGYHRCRRCGQGFFGKSTRFSHAKFCYYREEEYDWEDMNDLATWEPYVYHKSPKVSRSPSFTESEYELVKAACSSSGDDLGWDIWHEWYENSKLEDPPLYQQMNNAPISNPGQVGLIAPGVVRAIDSTTLIDPSMGTETNVPLMRMSTMNDSVNLSTDISSKLDRRVMLGIFKVPSGMNSEFYSESFPYSLLNAKGFYGADIVSTHEYLSIDRLRFNVQVPTEISVTGQIQIYWIPGNLDSHVRVNTTTNSSYYNPENFIDVHSVILDLGNENSVSLEVPCISPLNSLRIGDICNPGQSFDSTNATMAQEIRFNSYGKLYMRTFTSVTGITSSLSLDAIVTVEPIGMKVQFQTRKHSIVTDVAAPAFRQQGVVLGTLAAAGAVAASAAASTAAAAAPAIGAALGTAAVGATMGAISKIGKNCTVFDSVSNDIGTLNLSSGHDTRTCTVVGYKASDVKSSFYEIDNTVETVTDMTKLKSRISNFKWGVSSISNTLLYSTPVHPLMGVDIDRTAVLNAALLTSNMGYLSTFYNYWRGSIDLTIEVVGNAFTRGTLAIVHFPPGENPATSYSIDERTSLFSTITFNVQDTRRIVVNIPFNSTTQWLRTWYVNNFATNPPGVYQGGSIGNIGIYVVSPLRVQTISDATLVPVNVYVSSSDMEFFQPVERKGYSPAPTWYGPAISRDNLVGQTLSDSPEVQVSTVGAIVNEEPPMISFSKHDDLMALTTIRSAYGIFQIDGYVKFVIPIPSTYMTRYNNTEGSSSYVVEYSHYSTIAQCFAWMTGAMALTVMNLAATSSEMSYVINVDYSDISSGAYPATDRSIETYPSSREEYVSLVKGDNTLIHNFTLNQVHSITFPHYNKYNVLPAPIVGRSKSEVLADGLDAVPTYYRYAEATLIFKSAPGGEVLFSQSAGPGLKFQQFLGAPKIYEGSLTRTSDARDETPTKKIFSRPRPRIVRFSDEVDEAQPELRQQGILSKDNQSKITDTLETVSNVAGAYSHTGLHMNELLSKASDLIPNISKTNDSVNETIHEFKESMPGFVKTSDTIGDSMSSIKTSTEKASNCFETMASKLTDFIEKVDKRFFTPKATTGVQSISGTMSKQKEIHLISVLMDCAAKECMMPLVDEILVEMYDLVRSALPKTSSILKWVTHGIKAAAGALFLGTRFGNLLAAEVIHDTLSLGLDMYGNHVQTSELRQQGPPDLIGSISLIISLLLATVTSVTFGLVLPETVTLMGTLKTMFLITGGVMTITRFIESIVKAISFIKDSYFPTEEDMISKSWYERNREKIDTMMNTYMLTTSISQLDVEEDEALCTQVAQIAPFCAEFVINITKLGAKDANFKLVLKYAEELIKLATYLKTSLPSKNRPVPVMFTFQGVSQIGKTYLVSNVIPGILGKALSRVEPMTIYEKNSMSKFYDRYNYQDILLLNDLGSLTDQSDLGDILMIMGNQPHFLNMAAVSDKGTTFRSTFAFVTTNSAVIDANKVVTNPDAVHNRLYRNAYEVTLKPTYETPEGQIDTRKVSENNPTPDEVWTFTRFKVDRTGNRYSGGQTTLRKIILAMVTQYRENRENVTQKTGTGLDCSSYDDLADHNPNTEKVDDVAFSVPPPPNAWTVPLKFPPPGKKVEEKSNSIIDSIDDSFKLELKQQTGGLLSGHPPKGRRTVKYFEQAKTFINKLKDRWCIDRTGIKFDKEDTSSPTSKSPTYLGYSRIKCSQMINQLLNWPCPDTELESYSPKFYKDISVKFGSFPREAQIDYPWQDTWLKALSEEDYKSMPQPGLVKSTGVHSLGAVKKSVLSTYFAIDKYIEKAWNFGQGKGGFLIDSLLKFFKAQVLVMGVLVGLDTVKYAYGSFSRVFNKEMKLYNFTIGKLGGSYYDKASKDENISVADRTIAGVYSSFYNPQPQQAANFYGVTATDATPRKRVTRKLVPKNPQPQQGQTADMSDIIKENVAVLTNVTGGGSQHAMMVGRDVFVANTHFFNRVKDGDTCRLTFSNNTQIAFNIDFKNHISYEFEANERGSVEQDVSFYRIGYDSRSFKDISNHFIKEEDVDKAHNCNGYRMEINPTKLVTTNWRIQDAKVTLDNGRGSLLFTDVVMGLIPGDSGMCGLPLIATNTSYFGNVGKIIAVHGFGTADRSGGQFVTQEMVKMALKDLPSPVRATPETPHVFQQGKYKEPVIPEDEIPVPMLFPSDTSPNISYDYYTEVRPAVGDEVSFQVSKTAYRKSPLYGKFPITHDYSVASKYDKRLSPEVAYSFNHNLMKKTNTPGIIIDPFPPMHKTLIRNRILDIWKDKRTLVLGRTFTMAEAINGLEFGDVEKWTRELGLVMNKSAGPIYNKQGKHKYPHFGVIEHVDGSKHYFPKQYLQDRIEMRIMMAKNYQVPDDSLCGDSIKDELRKLEKVASGSSRLVNFFQLDFMIVFGMYFGAFRAMFSDPKNVGVKLFSALGVDPRRLFPAIGRDLKYSRHLFGIDYTSYDASIPGALHEFMVTIINAWYIKNGDSEENCRIREVLWWECVHTKHVFGDTVYTDHHGLPSGVPCGFTTISNILINTILVSLTLIRLDIPIEFLGTVIQAVFMGDDNLIWIREDAPKVNELTDKFTRIAVATTALSFGMKATMPNKSTNLTPYDSFENITFLKSYFKDSVVPGYYLPAMDQATIYSMLTYYKPKGKTIDVNQLTVNISQALDFAVPWGHEFYDGLMAVLKEDEQLASILSTDQKDELFVPLVLRFNRAF